VDEVDEEAMDGPSPDTLDPSQEASPATICNSENSRKSTNSKLAGVVVAEVVELLVLLDRLLEDSPVHLDNAIWMKSTNLKLAEVVVVVVAELLVQ